MSTPAFSAPGFIAGLIASVMPAPLPEATPTELRAALETALRETRDLSINGLNTQTPKFDAVLGCLHAMSRLDLTVLQAHLLLTFARQPEQTMEAIAADLHQPFVAVGNATAELFMRGLVLIPVGGLVQLTEPGINCATVIIACTSLAEAGHAQRRLDAARTTTPQRA